ncbi:hypothetical protein RQP46_006163 [Phenoliferia psychrophenolica]
MAFSLPDVPAGANPWTALREGIDAGFFNSPTEGFKSRTYVLYSVLGYQHAVNALFTVVSACTLLAYVYYQYSLFTIHEYLDIAILLRAWVWIWLWLHGYFVSSASLQMYITTSEGVGDGGYTVSAPVANGIFLGVGCAVLAELLAACALVTIRWREVYRTYEYLSAFLESTESKWTDGASQDAALTALLPLLMTFNQKYKPFENPVCLDSPIINHSPEPKVGAGFVYNPSASATGAAPAPLFKSYGMVAENNVNQAERINILVSLQRAESELIVVSAATILLCLAFTATSVWTDIVGFQLSIAWVPLEISVFIVPWAWSIVIAFTLTFLCTHVLRSLLRPNRPESPTTRSPSMPSTKTSRMPMIWGHKTHRAAVSTPVVEAPPMMVQFPATTPRASVTDQRMASYSRNKSWSHNVMDER